MGPVTAAFSYKPFCSTCISKIMCIHYFDKLIKVLVFQNRSRLESAVLGQAGQWEGMHE